MDRLLRGGEDYNVEFPDRAKADDASEVDGSRGVHLSLDHRLCLVKEAVGVQKYHADHLPRLQVVHDARIKLRRGGVHGHLLPCHWIHRRLEHAHLETIERCADEVRYGYEDS